MITAAERGRCRAEAGAPSPALIFVRAAEYRSGRPDRTPKWHAAWDLHYDPDESTWSIRYWSWFYRGWCWKRIGRPAGLSLYAPRDSLTS